MTAFPALSSLRLALFGLIVGLAIGAVLPAMAQGVAAPLPDRVLGNAAAPVTVEEFVSLTCPHCADFTTEVLPALEKNYIATGKVKVILRDFPLDGAALKAATLARCMPADEFYPFISVLFKNQSSWALASDIDKKLVQYATLGGLPADKAQACLADASMQEAVANERSDATTKYDVQSTPTFIINGGADKIEGAMPATAFAAAFDKQLAIKK